MLAEISRIVTEDISNRVTQYDVLFEAITNSIHANATTIKCYLNSNDSQLSDDTKEIGSIRVDTIRIIDNGDGLTDENYKSFSKYRTEFKKALKHPIVLVLSVLLRKYLCKPLIFSY